MDSSQPQNNQAPPYGIPLSVSSNPLPVLQRIGCKYSLENESLDSTGNCKVELTIEGIPKRFYSECKGRKNARKHAACLALAYLSSPSNIPPGVTFNLSLLRLSPEHNSSLNETPLLGCTSSSVPVSTVTDLQQEPSNLSTPQSQSTQSSLCNQPDYILKEKYPDAIIVTQSSCTVHVRGKTFNVTLPSNDMELCRLAAAADALKWLDNATFPEITSRRNNTLEEPSNSTTQDEHPVCILNKEFPTKVIYSEFNSNDEFTVKIQSLSRVGPLVYSIAPATTIRESKYIVAMKAIKDLKLDTKYKISPFSSKSKKIARKRSNECNNSSTIDHNNDDSTISSINSSLYKDKISRDEAEQQILSPSKISKLMTDPSNLVLNNSNSDSNTCNNDDISNNNNINNNDTNNINTTNNNNTDSNNFSLKINTSSSRDSIEPATVNADTSSSIKEKVTITDTGSDGNTANANTTGIDVTTDIISTPSHLLKTSPANNSNCTIDNKNMESYNIPNTTNSNANVSTNN